MGGSGELNSEERERERERERAFSRSPQKGRPGNRVRGGPGYVNGTEVGWRLAGAGAAGERRRTRTQVGMRETNGIVALPIDALPSARAPAVAVVAE